MKKAARGKIANNETSDSLLSKSAYSNKGQLPIVDSPIVHHIESDVQKEEFELAKEKALISAKYLDNIINNIGDPFFVKDEQSRILLVNDAFCTLFELERDHILGKTLAEDVSPEEMESFLKIDKQVLKTGEEHIIEESLTVRGGQTKTISTRKTRYVDGNDKKYLIGVIRDLTERKRAEEQLKESLSHNELAVDISKLGVWQLNVDSGELLWNDRHLEFYGITREEFTNDIDGWRNQLHPDDKLYAEGRFKEVFETWESMQDLNFRIIRPNGEIRYLNASGTPIIIDGKLVKIIGVNRDITEQKIAEKNLKETISRLNLAVNTAKLGVWSLDVKTRELDWNDRLFEIYGMIPTEFNYSQDTFEKLVHPDDLEHVMSSHVEISLGKSVTSLEFRIIRPNKEVRYINGTASPVFVDDQLEKIIGINRDITESKIANENLKETLSRLNLAVDTAKLGIWSFNAKTGEVLWNDEMFEIFATAPSEFDDTLDSFTKRVHPEDIESVNGQMGAVFQNTSIFNFQFRIIRPNGELRYIDASASPVLVDGQVEKIIGINRDITENKKSEKRLEEALIQLTALKLQIEAENIYLKEELKLDGSFNEIVGSDKSLKKVLKQVEQVSKTDTTVLLLGETGTGKELIARAIHNASDRKDKPMIKVNCSAIPSELIESEFFGHEIGAFTSAVNRKIGRFELANGGTIFLDEIGDLHYGLQTRLLRVLQEKEFERVGGETTIKVDVRVIAATNRNLKEEIANGNFRQDLYYRLNVFPITCPPLRERIEDVPILVNHFVNKYNHKVNKKIKAVNQKSLDRLMRYEWPGNVRELEHVIERAVIVNQGGQLRLGNWFMDSDLDTVVSDGLTTLDIVERDYIIKVLEKTNWKIRGKNGASEILGLKPTTLESRLKKMDIRR